MGVGTEIKSSGDVHTSTLSPNSGEGRHATMPNPPRLRKKEALASDMPQTCLSQGSFFVSGMHEATSLLTAHSLPPTPHLGLAGGTRTTYSVQGEIEGVTRIQIQVRLGVEWGRGMGEVIVADWQEPV